MRIRAALFALALTLRGQSVITPGPGNPTTYLLPGTTFTPGVAAVIDALGRIGAAPGSPTNCVLVNGTSGPCGFTGSILPSNILSGGAQVGQALVWNGSNYAPTNQSGGGGGGSLTTYLNSTLIGTRPIYNFLAGPGALLALSDTGTAISIEISADTSYMASSANIQSGTLLYAASTSASGTTYTACPAQVTSALTTGMTFDWVPDVNGTGGATTLNLCTLGTLSLYEADGATNPSSTDIVAGRLYRVSLDAAGHWRLPAGGSGGGGSSSCVSVSGIDGFWPFGNGYFVNSYLQTHFAVGASGVNVFTIQCPMTISHITFSVDAASGTSCTGGTCGLVFSLYNSTSGAPLGKTTPIVSGGSPNLNATGVISATFTSPVTLTMTGGIGGGSSYYMVANSDSTALTLSGALPYTGGGAYIGAFLNAKGNRSGIAANSSSGDGASIAPPSTLGSISGKTDGYGTPPAVYIEP